MAARGKIRQFPTAFKLKNYGDSALNPTGQRLTVFRYGWLRPAFAWFENAPGSALEAGEKAVVSERPTDALRGAQGSEQISLRFACKQIGEIWKAIPDRRQRGDAVVLAAQMRTRRRPSPILCPLDQPRPHRVERYIAQRRREMFLVHGDGAEPALPEMTAAFAPRLNDSRIASMDACQCAAQPVRIGRHQDEVNVIRHQAPAPHLDPGRGAIGGEQVAIKRIVGLAEESPRAAVAALGDMVRMTGDDDTGEAGHAAGCQSGQDKSIECTVTVILEAEVHDGGRAQNHPRPQRRCA